MKTKFDVQLTEHFKLSEFFVTNQNYNDVDVISKDIYQNLCSIAQILEYLRFKLQSPIIITSGYRSFKLNDMVLGANDSYHKYGCAVDITFPFNEKYTDVYNNAINILHDMVFLFAQSDGKFIISELLGSKSCRFIHLAINSETCPKKYKHIKNLNYYE